MHNDFFNKHNLPPPQKKKKKNLSSHPKAMKWVKLNDPHKKSSEKMNQVCGWFMAFSSLTKQDTN